MPEGWSRKPAPTGRHSGARSNKVTSCPCRRSKVAAAGPADPQPTTAIRSAFLTLRMVHPFPEAASFCGIRLMEILRLAKAVRVGPGMREFNQPELTGPSGEPIEVPDSLAARILGFASEDGESFALMEDSDPQLIASVLAHAKALAVEKNENAVLLSCDGKVIRREVGSERVVAVPSLLLRGSNLVHNHPAGTPLGAEDIENMLLHGMASVWAVGGPWLYGAKAGSRRISLPDLRLRSDYLNRAIYSVLADAFRHGSLPDVQESRLESIHLHALWSELAREGFIRYARSRYET
jgi:hypothetical protein